MSVLHMLGAIEALPYIQVKRSSRAPLRIIFQKGKYSERLPLTFRGFLSHYRRAMQTVGLPDLQVRQVMQACPGTLSHVLQVWRLDQPARYGGAAWGAVDENCVAEICAAGGWLPAAPLTSADLEMLLGTGGNFARSTRLAVLRKALVHSGLASTVPQMRVRPRTVCISARVPDLTPHSLRTLKADHIAALMLP